ncbi:hypothetical protein ACLQ2Q_07365 [Microbacterium sp. DT81.1]|uniref:hypothetical protein n=1 Tax=Microbacterium sp. DT81.1 TaxID=3393413 RepID=UPI003CEA69F7
MSATGILGRNAGAEWTRLWSVRSSWLFVLGAAAGVIGLSVFVGVSQGASAPVGGSPWRLAGIFGLLGLFAILVLTTVAATADHATKSIIPTLQWTPQRAIVVAARAGILVLTAACLGLVLMTAASLVIWVFAPQLTFWSAEGAAALAGATLVYATGGLLAVGLGLATRNTAAALTSVFALMLVLPLILQAFPLDWMVHVIGGLPGSGAFFFLLGEGPGDTRMTASSSSIVLIAWSVAALAAGTWRLLRTDAT